MVQAAKAALFSKAENIKGMNVIAQRVNVPHADALKNIAFGLKQNMGKVVVIIGAVVNDKPSLAILIDENVVKEKNLNAGNIVREAAKLMKGGGGGQPHFATAGGSDIKGLDDAIEAAKAAVTG
ncbi:Alanine--tRNA ligase [compost metagenome]